MCNSSKNFLLKLLFLTTLYVSFIHKTLRPSWTRTAKSERRRRRPKFLVRQWAVIHTKDKDSCDSLYIT
jgi:hypothetical protein